MGERRISKVLIANPEGGVKWPAGFRVPGFSTPHPHPRRQPFPPTVAADVPKSVDQATASRVRLTSFESGSPAPFSQNRLAARNGFRTAGDSSSASSSTAELNL